MGIINSLLDQDQYTFTVMQLAMHQFNSTNVEFSFKCRNKANWTESLVEDLRKELDEFCKLKFNEKELDFLGSLSFIKESFIDFLRLFQPNRNHIKVSLENEELKIKVTGPWYLIVIFEVPVLAIVNELYFKSAKISGAFNKLEEKLNLIKNIKDFRFADFGTRRRYSRDWQEVVVETCSKIVPGSFVGTSNVKLAMDYRLKPIGTMSHQLIMAGQNVGVRLADSQKRMLQAWVDEYRGDLGIALSDTLGLNAFLKDFDGYFAKLYDGVRHDSGDPIWWGEKMLAHYNKLGIDAKSKTFVFSDGLTFPEAIKILEHFRDRVKVTFGIGTNLTNDFDDIEPLQIVIKMTSCNRRPVAKISDSAGKGMCRDEDYLKYLKSVFNITT